MDKQSLYQQKAIAYAETYGIIKYRVSENKIIYNVSYPAYLSNPRYTIQHIVNLDTGEHSSRQLGRFDKDGLYNRG